MKVYIASPYGRRNGYSINELDTNVHIAIQAGRELILKGHTPFIPHMYHFVHRYWDKSPDESVWLNICLAWLPFCECVLRLNGVSWGADREVKIAKEAGIPVYYSLEEVPNV